MINIKHVVLFFVLIITITAASAEEDKVYVLDHINYTHDYYSGYFSASFADRIHYVFFQSQSDPGKDPLLIFLNGGPGCSSLASLFHQNGPFIFLPGAQQLTINENAWNKKANLLYLQLPSGVGFSISANASRQHDDIQTSNQAFAALRQFYNRFPAYRARDLYLSGHGYAAVFQANLARRIIEHNEDPYEIMEGKINLKGLLLGNPCVTPEQCYPGAQKHSYYYYRYLYQRAFITKHMFQKFNGACALDYNSFDCFNERNSLDTFFNSTNSSSLNIYAKCYKTVNNSQGVSVINSGCDDQSGVITYLNQEAQKQNWHVPKDVNWTVCNWQIFEKYIPAKNSYHLMPLLRSKGLRLWVFSGDFSAEVPITGTKAWINRFKQQYQVHTKKRWRQWWVPGLHKGQDQVGGHIWQLDGLTFVSVRGAGFRAGIDKPQPMEEILNGFLAGTTLPKNPNLQPMQKIKTSSQ